MDTLIGTSSITPFISGSVRIRPPIVGQVEFPWEFLDYQLGVFTSAARQPRGRCFFQSRGK